MSGLHRRANQQSEYLKQALHSLMSWAFIKIISIIIDVSYSCTFLVLCILETTVLTWHMKWHSIAFQIMYEFIGVKKKYEGKI